MPSAQDIAKAMGTTQEKGEQLYMEFADWSAQRLSQYDKRDQQQIKGIAVEVQKLSARMRTNLVDENDYVYVSKHAPSGFKSSTMFDRKDKIARIEEMFRKDDANKERMKSIRETNVEDVPMKSGNVAEKAKNFQTGQQKQEFPYRGMPKKRSTSALDGVAEPPPAKRMAVQKEP